MFIVKYFLGLISQGSVNGLRNKLCLRQSFVYAKNFTRVRIYVHLLSDPHLIALCS